MTIFSSTGPPSRVAGRVRLRGVREYTEQPSGEEEDVHISTSAGDLPVYFDGSEGASTVLILGHGAGAGSTSEFMDRFAGGLADDHLRVCRFDFAYMAAGRKSPDRQSVLEQAFSELAESVRGGHENLLLGGKSMGGRIASTIVAAGFPADALVFLGYPLHPPGRPDRIRDAHLHDVGVPMLFVEGTRDPFCPLDTLERVRAEITAESDVVVIDDGDHSLKVRKSSGRETAAAWDEAIERIKGWLKARGLVDGD
jgi:predicted alpha/beta-hydrolase family hydrolase